ncbi:MAG: endonuclease/exonuclease/phosphatase family protein [Flavobacteriales bacterium]|nr:endonuclease/exonuclease/phosphatase family protein [Flavobacteriales bacterium]
MKKALVLFAFLSAIAVFWASCTKKNYLGIAFYNVENLFDTIDDPNTLDGEFTPDSAKHWNTEKYFAKLNNLAKVLTTYQSNQTPDFVGLCEVENRLVLEDLLKADALKDKNLDIVHFESPDLRGIDVAALYNTKKLKMLDSGKHPLDLSEYGETTRDVLWVKMLEKSTKEQFIFLINHWPSRRGGLEESEPKRILAAQNLKHLKDSLLKQNAGINLIVMGDFNDEPDNKSIKEALDATNQTEINNAQLFNVMAALKAVGQGSYRFRDDWNMLDQLMVNSALLDNQKWEYERNSAGIRNEDWLQQHSEKYEGHPLRTFGGNNYLNGYSDHFSVYMLLSYHP